MINQTFKIIPRHPKALYQLALVYLDQGDILKARLYLNRALKIWENADPEFLPAQQARKTLQGLTKY
jgi:tetratricopeptide (TPR) repeat protein